MSAGDVGQPVMGPGFTDRSFQMEGGVGDAVVEGSNDGINYHTLDDPFANPLVYTATGVKQVTEITLWVRPNISVGTGINVTAVFCNHSRN